MNLKTTADIFRFPKPDEEHPYEYGVTFFDRTQPEEKFQRIVFVGPSHAVQGGAILRVDVMDGYISTGSGTLWLDREMLKSLRNYLTVLLEG